MSGQLQTQGTKEWQNGPLGCFADPKLCILSFICPCYLVGRNAEALGEDCLLTGLLAAVGFMFGPVVRWRLRQERSLKGSMLMDVLMYTCLPCCALVQEAREIGWNMPKKLADVGTVNEGSTNGAPPASAPDQTPDMERH